jgi:large subunit ribosomal protein L13
MFQQKTYQAKQSGPHYFEPTGPNAPKWYVVDVKDQVVGRIATVIARVVTGKHKPTYTRHADAGDFIVVLNAGKAVFTRNKPNTKLYRHHSGFISGLKTSTAKEMLEKNPEEVIRQAVWGMTNKTNLARHQMKKLKIFAADQHDHAAQNPQPLPAGVIRHTVASKTKKKA